MIARLTFVLCFSSAIMHPACLRAADFQITRDVLTEHFVGFGANLSPAVYCTPNWPTEVNDANIADFEKRVLDLHPQHVRIFIRPDWWDTDTDPQRGQSVERECRLMQRAGATVNLTLWGGVHAAGAAMGARTAAVFNHLIHDQHLTCIQYATLQNEPNGFDMDKQVYLALYTSFDAELRRLGLRDHLKIIGGDLLSTNQEQWLAFLAKDLPAILDGYSIHMYSDYWDTAHMAARLAAIPPIIAALPPSGRKPLYLMEFGVRGHRAPKEEPGRDEQGRPLYEQPLAGALLAYHIIEAVNQGYVATCQWDMADMMYNRSHMHYGLIGEAKDHFPAKPCYFMMQLLTHSAAPGCATLKVTGQADSRSVAALRSADGHWTLLVVNRSQSPSPLSLSGLQPGAYRLHLWNGDGHGIVQDLGTSSVGADGAFSTSLPALSVLVLTSADPQ